MVRGCLPFHLLSRLLPVGLCPGVRNKCRDMTLMMLFYMTKYVPDHLQLLNGFTCHLLSVVLHFLINAELSAYKLIEIGRSPGFGEGQGIDSCVSFLRNQSLHQHLCVPRGGAFQRRHLEYKNQGMKLV